MQALRVIAEIWFLIGMGTMCGLGWIYWRSGKEAREEDEIPAQAVSKSAAAV